MAEQNAGADCLPCIRLLSGAAINPWVTRKAVLPPSLQAAEAALARRGWRTGGKHPAQASRKERVLHRMLEALLTREAPMSSALAGNLSAFLFNCPRALRADGQFYRSFGRVLSGAHQVRLCVDADSVDLRF